MMKKECFFEEKKRSYFLKLHIYQIGKAEIMPLVASRLVLGNSKQANLEPKIKEVKRWKAIKSASSHRLRQKQKDIAWFVDKLVQL